jgi:hypothetical protein
MNGKLTLTQFQAEEWLYFLSGSARATAFVGNVSQPTPKAPYIPPASI